MDQQREVPVIDLSLAECNCDLLVTQIAQACSSFGFFQIINHGIDRELVEEFRSSGVSALSAKEGSCKRRSQENSRGYFDDELTKQKRDWKQALDVGVPGSRTWSLPDDDPRNACLEGFNRFPKENPSFRTTLVEYFEQCELLADRLANLMAKGVLSSTNERDDQIVSDLKSKHTSYLRLNYYPACTKENELGVSPHRDAGFLTILLQDDDCHSLQVWFEEMWHTVTPIPGALTINTGDMAQIWSNGRYQAPLHRVLTNSSTSRFTAPFFYNPPYETYVQPVVSEPSSVNYHACLWGYFRALRFAGDFSDLGTEIQVEDFHVSSHSLHRKRQERISHFLSWDEPFSVEKLQELLAEETLGGGNK